MAKSIKETVREMREKEKAGGSIKRITPEDPMMIKDDEDQSNLMSEMTTGQQELNLDALSQEDSKSEPEKDEATKVGLADDFSDEEGKDTKVETDSFKGTETETEDREAQAKVSETPSEPGRKRKVKTVYGEEELTDEEVNAGYMRNAHYTQVMQTVREQERIVRNLLSDPRNLVEFAMQNGVDLKSLVHVEPEIQEFALPELSEYATETEKAMYEFLKQQNAVNKKLAEKVSGFESTFKKSQSGTMNDQIENEFKEKRVTTETPETASHAVYAMFKEGQRLFGKAYTIQSALADFRKAEGDIGQRWLSSARGQQWYETEKRKIIAEYISGKDKQREETLAPDSLAPSKARVSSDGKLKVKDLEHGRSLAKKALGIFAKK